MKKFIKFALLLGLFILVAGASAYLTLTWIVRGEETVVVPDLREKDLVAVLELLTDLGLNAKVRKLEYHQVVPKSRVIFQDPEPGDEIKKGRDVRIIISKGPKTVYMPNLTGSPLRQVDIVLEENGLCRGNLSETYSERHETGTVISQEPPPGTILDRESCVNLLVSLGHRPKAYLMPDLVGRNVSDAMEAIESLGLLPGQISSTLEQNRPPDTVILQTPLSGYRVEEGSRVDLVVNRKIDPLSGGDQAGIPRVLFRHRTGHGFLNRHIRVELRGYGPPLEFFDDYVKPGRELWFIVPKHDGASVRIYENGKLVGDREAGSAYRISEIGDRRAAAERKKEREGLYPVF